MRARTIDAGWSPPRTTRSGALTLVVLCAGMLMIVLDQTIVNVALPSIRRDLGFTPSGLAWVVNAYLIAFGGLLLLAGRLGDLIGRRRVLVAGLVLFTLASLLCGLSQSRGMLIGARFAQGAAGALTSSVILGIIVMTFADARERARATGVVSLALLGGFVAREATAARPLLPLRVFRSRTVSGANVIQALMVGAMFGVFFLGSLYMQQVLGYGAVQIGLAFLPVALAIGILSLGFSERLNTRFGARRVLVPGLGLIAVGLALIVRVPIQADYVRDFLPAMLLLGVGAGLSFPALMSLSMSAATPSDSGLASGLANTSLQVGGALGLAVLATLAAGRTGRLAADGQTAAAALTGGYHLAVVLGTGFVVVALALAATVLRPSPAAMSDENAIVGEAPAIEELAVEKLAVEQL